MATATETAPELTILNRLGSIPLVVDSLSAVHSTLSAHTLTAAPYHTASAVSLAALGAAQRVTSPLQARFAPVLLRADGLANAAVDAVEARCPYPFKASSQDVYNDLTNRSDEARAAAHKTIDERVYAPAGKVVSGIDQRFAPLVDYIETYVTKLTPSTSSSPESSPSSSDAGAPAPYQYQRAYALAFQARDGLFVLSQEQARALHEQSALVRRAEATAAQLAGAASAASTRAHALAEAMVSELQSIKNAGQALPAHLEASFGAVNKELAGTIAELSAVLGDRELGAADMAARVRDTVQHRVQPLLDATAARVGEVLGALRERKDGAKKKVAEEYEANGNGNAVAVVPDAEEASAAFETAAAKAGIKVAHGEEPAPGTSYAEKVKSDDPEQH